MDIYLPIYWAARSSWAYPDLQGNPPNKHSDSFYGSYPYSLPFRDGSRSCSVENDICSSRNTRLLPSITSGIRKHLMPTTKSVIQHVRMVFSRTPWYAELFSGGVAIGWSIQAWLSPAEMGRWASMDFLLTVADARFWHIAGFSCGFLQLAFLVIDKRWYRWILALVMCWFYTFLTFSVRASVPWSPDLIVYGGWACVNFCSIMRLLRRNV